MKLSAWSCAIASAVVWALGVLLVGLANLKWPSYGQTFLDLVASIYPGYKAMGSATLGGVIVGTLYALLDGFVCGLVFAWIYNAAACCQSQGSASTPKPM